MYIVDLKNQINKIIFVRKYFSKIIIRKTDNNFGTSCDGGSISKLYKKDFVYIARYLSFS